MKIEFEDKHSIEEFIIKDGKIIRKFRDKTAEVASERTTSLNHFTYDLMMNIISEEIGCKVNGVVYWEPVKKMTSTVFKERLEKSAKLLDDVEKLVEG